MDFKFVLTSNTFLTEEKQDILKVEKIDYESLLMPKYVDPNIDNIHYEIVQYAIAVSRFFNKMIGYLQYLYLPNKGILIKQLEYRGYIMYEFYVDGRFDTAFVTDEYDDYNTYEELVKHLIKKYGKYLRFREQDYKCKLKYYADEDEIDGYCYITYTHKFKDKEIIVKSGDNYSENVITKNFIKELNKVLGWNIKYKRE